MVDVANIRARQERARRGSAEDRLFHQALVLDFMFNRAHISPRMEAALRRIEAGRERAELGRAS